MIEENSTITDPITKSGKLLAYTYPHHKKWVMQIEKEAWDLHYNFTATTWRGVCGHLWDRLVENTDICPRCAEKDTKAVEIGFERGLRLYEAVRQIVVNGVDSPGVRTELHQAFYSIRDRKDY